MTQEMLRIWPSMMRAKTAARYCDETSTAAFRLRVGSVYPHPVTIPGRGKVWIKEELDQAIAKLRQEGAETVVDAATLL